MKVLLKGLLFVSMFIFLLGCGSSVKVTEAWKANDVQQIKSEQFLVMARSDSRSSRQIFENEIAAQLREKGIDAVESYTKYPDLNLNKKVSEADTDKFISTVLADGFEVIVLTVTKDKRTEVNVESSGGYYAGYPSMYRGYRGFRGYYGRYYSPYGMGGSYVPETQRTYSSDVYMLETVMYDLRRENDNQLVAVIGVDVSDPVSASDIVTEYAKKVVGQLK